MGGVEMTEPIEVHDSQAAETLAQEAGGIKQELAQLTGIVTTLAGAMSAQLATTTKRSKINWYSTVALIISFLFDVVLTGYLFNVEQQVRHQQDITSSIVLCPVWNLILTGYHPELRPAGPLRDQYIQSYQAILAGRTALRCTGNFAPVRIPSPTPSTSPSKKHR
jgi:hypothetical protein